MRLQERNCTPKPDDSDVAAACDRYIDTIEDEVQWLQKQLDRKRSRQRHSTVTFVPQRESGQLTPLRVKERTISQRENTLQQ